MKKCKQLFLIIFTFIFFLPLFTNAASNEYEITAIDYGPESKGDATLISNNGHYMLIDTSNPASDTDVYGNTITNKEDKVIKYLQGRGITSLDLYISHYHVDHNGYVNKILDTFTVDKLYLPNIDYIERFSGSEYSSYSWYPTFAPTGSSSQLVKYNSFLTKAQEKGTQVVTLNKGSTFSVGNITAKVLWREDGSDDNISGGVDNTSLANDLINNCSLVTLFKMGSIKYLNAGDIEKATENKILASNIDISADIFKLSHHGNPGSNSENFLNAIRAKYYYVMFNYDTETDFGGKSDSEHYRIEAYNRYMTHANLYASRYNGTTTFKIKDNQIDVSTVRNKKTLTINYYDSETNEIIQTRKIDYNSAANYYLVNPRIMIDNYEFDVENENNSSYIDGMKPTADMTLNFYYNKIAGAGDDDGEEDYDDDVPTPTPPSKDEEYVEIPNTFSGKNIALYLMGGLFILSGTFIIIRNN